MIPWWILILIGLVVGAAGTAVVLTEHERQIVNNLVARINGLQTQLSRLESKVAEMQVIYQTDVNQINAQLNSLVLEIQSLKRQYAANAEMLQTLEGLETRMRELSDARERR